MDQDAIIAAALTLIGSYLLVIAVIYILTVIGWWKLFTKAGEAGWKSLIPFVNTYTLYKISWSTVFFWISTLILFGSSMLGLFVDPNNPGTLWSIVAIVLLVILAVFGVMMNLKLSKAFGHGVGFGIGLIFLHTVFVMILAFGKSQYVGNKK